MPSSDKQSNSFDSQSPTYLGSDEQIAARLTAGVDNNIISPKHENVFRKEDREPLRTIGEFTLIREIGRGGMGVVYEATQASLDRRVALKTLPVSGRMDQRQIQRFQNEARAAAQLQHPNIVPVFSIGTEAGIHYYAMQLIPGHDLAHFIRHAKTLLESPRAPRSGDTPKFAPGTTAQVLQPTPGVLRTGTDSAVAEGSTLSVPLSGFIDMMADHKSSVADRKAFESILQIGIQAAEALHFAHQLGIVHRDIKPSNLMLDNEGKLWVTDFGLAQIQGAGALTMTGEVIGTLRYMSPEQPLGQRVLVDQRTDVYSLGVTLYELLTFRKAFGGDTPKEIIRQVCFDEPVSIRRLNPRVPEDLETIVLRAMSKNPDDRYQSAQELADDLERFRTDQPISARRPTLLQQGRRWIRRHVALATSVAVGIVLLLLTSLTATGMIWNSLNAETLQRQRAESLLDKSEGLRLIANSALVKAENPGLALLLAVKGAELSPGVDANTALLNALGSNHELKTFSPRNESTGTLCISPDGKRVVTTVPGSLRLSGSFPAVESNLATGEPVQSFDDGSALISAAYSPNGRYLLMISRSPRNGIQIKSEDNSVPALNESETTPTLWDVESGRKRHSFNDAHVDTAIGAAFSPSSEQLALPGRDNDVKIYSTIDGRLQGSMKGHAKRVLSVAFSPDGRRLVSVAKDNTVRVWDTLSGDELRQFQATSSDRYPVVAAFVDNSDKLLVSSAGGSQLLSVESGQQLNPRHWPETASKVSRDGRLIALYLRFGEDVSVWDSRSLVRLCRFKALDRVADVDISDDGKSLIATGRTEAGIYRTEDGELAARLQGHTGRIRKALFVSDNKRVVTVADDRTVRSWRILNGADDNIVMRHPAELFASPWSFSKDGALVSVSTRASLYTDLRDKNGLPVASSYSGNLHAHAAGSAHLVTIDHDEVIIWNALTSRRISALKFETDKVVNALAVTGSDVVLIRLENQPAVLWNPSTGTRVQASDPQERVTAVDVHPSEPKVIVAQQNGECRLLDPRTGALLQVLPHQFHVLRAHFSPSGARVVTIDSQNSVHLWGLDKDVPERTIHEPDALINNAGFSGDESAILTWCDTNSDLVRVWSSASGELLGKTSFGLTPGVAIHPSLPLAALTSVDNGLILWNWENGTETSLTKSPAMTPRFGNGRLVAIEAMPEFQRTSEKTWGHPSREEFARSMITFRDAATGHLVANQPLAVDPANVTIDPDSENIILSYRQFETHVIRTDDHSVIAGIGNHSGPIAFQSFIGNSSNIAIASLDGRVSIWDQAGRRLHLLQQHNQPIRNAAISSDGLRLATFDASGNGLLWDTQSGQKIMDLQEHTKSLQSVQFSPSGRSLLTASLDDSIRIWDLISRTSQLLKFDQGVLHAEWSSDESQLLIVTGREASEARIQSGASPVPAAFLHNLKDGGRTALEVVGPIQLARFRPGRKQAIVLSKDGKVTLHDQATGRSLQTFNPNGQPAYRVAISPDGGELVMQHDQEISLWNVELCAEVARLPMKYDRSLKNWNDWVPFSFDGESLLTSGRGLQKWPRNLMKAALTQIPRPMSDEEKQRFLISAPVEPLVD